MGSVSYLHPGPRLDVILIDKLILSRASISTGPSVANNLPFFGLQLFRHWRHNPFLQLLLPQLIIRIPFTMISLLVFPLYTQHNKQNHQQSGHPNPNEKQYHPQRQSITC